MQNVNRRHRRVSPRHPRAPWLILIALFPLLSCGELVGFHPFPEPDLGDIERVEIGLHEDDRRALYESLSEDDAAPCTYQAQGRRVAARIQIRGFTSRLDPKKSFTVTLPAGGGVVQYALEAGYDSWATNRLAMRAYRLAGLPAPPADGVALFLNGEYLGYYTRLKMYNRKDLRARYGGKGGELFKCHFRRMGYDIPLYFRSEKKFPDDGDFSRLETLVLNARHLDEAAWKRWVDRSIDGEQIALYMAVHDYLNVVDTSRQNFYIYDYGRMLLLPWDNEKSMVRSMRPLGGHNLVTRRLLEDRAAGSIRSRYEERMRRLFLEPGPENLVDRLRAEAQRIFQEIDRAVYLDPGRPGGYEEYAAERNRVLDFLTWRSADLVAAGVWPGAAAQRAWR